MVKKMRKKKPMACLLESEATAEESVGMVDKRSCIGINAYYDERSKLLDSRMRRVTAEAARLEEVSQFTVRIAIFF